MSRSAGNVGRQVLRSSLFAFVDRPLHSARIVGSLGPAFRADYSSLSPGVGLRALQVKKHGLFHHVDIYTTEITPIRWPRSSASTVAQLNPSRRVHLQGRPSEALTRARGVWPAQKRWNSNDQNKNQKSVEQTSKSQQSEQAKNQDSVSASEEASNQHQHHHLLFDRLPHLHRPTKQELLAAATGFWHRLSVHFKWFSIRSVRPFNSEEIFAFASWIFWGHVLWIIIGTTTFFSLAIWAVNTIFAQETLASWVGNYLTKSVGIKVVFESAIVPNWRDGAIQFRNVFVSRRPVKDERERSVTKGSSLTAAAAAAQAEKDKGLTPVDLDLEPEDDGNYTQFDVTIDTVNVTLSFTKWFNGKGLLRDVEVRGIRGIVDRTSVQPSTGDEDPASYRHEHNHGDFEMDSFKMSDVLLTIYQPNNFRPFQVSVFNCELPRLRKQWLFYDFLSANNMSGSFDDSLFTIHPRQSHSFTGIPGIDGNQEDPQQWSKRSRLRIDGLQIDHLNRGVEGPFSWIYEGNVDIVADVLIPNDNSGSIVKVMSDFYDRMEATVINAQASSSRSTESRSNNTINNDTDSFMVHKQSEPAKESHSNDRFVVMDIQIHLNDMRASVPIFTRDLSYVNNALVRPIVAYINSHSHRDSDFIPISCRIVKGLNEFDGSWTVFDCGLLNDLSRETYDAFVRDIMDGKQRTRRMRKVGWWAAQVAAQALFVGLAGQLA